MQNETSPEESAKTSPSEDSSRAGSKDAAAAALVLEEHESESASTGEEEASSEHTWESEIRPLVKMLNAWAQRAGSVWALDESKAEDELLIAALCPVLDKWLPDTLSIGPEWALIGTSLALFGPRYFAWRQELDRRRFEEGVGEDAWAPDPTDPA